MERGPTVKRGAHVTCALAVGAAEFRIKSTFNTSSFTSSGQVIVPSIRATWRTNDSAGTVRTQKVRNVSATSAFASTTSEEAMAEKVVIAAACTEARAAGDRITFSAFGPVAMRDPAEEARDCAPGFRPQPIEERATKR